MSFLGLQTAGRPIIVGHRGASALCPENTLASFSRAINDGADAIEFDVQLSKDHEVVVFHDVKLKRICNVSGTVNEYTLSELKQFSAGTRFSQTYSKETIPELEEVFNLVKNQVGMNIELKSNGNLLEGRTLVKKCLTLINKYRIDSTVLVSSFDHSLLTRVKRENPDIQTGVLVTARNLFSREPERLALEAKADCYICAASLLNISKMIRLQNHNIAIGVYSFNTMSFPCRLFIKNGVNILFSDDPGQIIRGLKA